MTSEQERSLYYDGIQLFNDHDYFDAHEAWEDVWHVARGVKRDFYHGMIQCTVALEHYKRSNPRGVLSLYKSYQPKFARVPDVFMGLEVKKFLAAMEAVLGPVVTADPLPQRGEIELDLSACPKIKLLYDPFANGEAQREC